MLKWMRGKRLDLRTSIIILVVALVAWAFVVYANLIEFVPEEVREMQEAPRPRTP